MSNKSILYLHAVGTAIAWTVIFPIGTAIRKVTIRSRYHALIQASGAILAIIAMSAGIAISKSSPKHASLTSAHQILGLIVTPLLLVQAAGGLLNHALFKRTGKSSWINVVHKYLGPTLITIGMLNGYLGIDFADDQEYIKPYIITLVVWTFVLAMSTAVVRRYQRRGVSGIAEAPNAAIHRREVSDVVDASDSSTKIEL
ncbi:hypothetical protein AMS68_001140 [Peltaster fructicola]|uniref:Cytochrome b561 domain-containing protein n=1 Tax=Peltaster fructicola TaxID=286661 RepID=A0A6H0XLN1_9PEZI|nr:hypothetical protein AMS68_001140 [Peltaster fructicola]